ncbi:hypothetical protein TanjilG_32954 [Lupinus angustifolius]|uniref:Uncharacterized protein n=1 Tax=Lupinus angustifolius TaxID=3871 RepID=A0A4P1RNC2_LUPAN|nr:PREDICTED: auxin-responsive protein SAUR71-like [Lupinus angustifolius]OIW14612.1 hypothetical protein TanjilG_32954 [Lupinus angustifolius]
MKPSNKSNMIKQIVRLHQILKRLRKIANSPKTSRSRSNNSNKRTNILKRTLSLSESDGGSCNMVPKGYFAVCVGIELKRFVIPTEYLGHQAFHKLLREAEEEFGFEQTGVLRIPCEVSVFENILMIVSSQKCRFSVEKIIGYCSPNHLAYSH